MPDKIRNPMVRRWARRSWKSFEALLVIAMQDSTVAVLDEMDHEFIRMLRSAGAPRCIADVISYLKNVDEGVARPSKIYALKEKRGEFTRTAVTEFSCDLTSQDPAPDIKASHPRVGGDTEKGDLNNKNYYYNFCKPHSGHISGLCLNY